MARTRADVGGDLPVAPETAEDSGGAGAVPESPGAKEGHGKPSETISLPTQATPASTTLVDKTILIYGPPGVGKSTLASEFGKVLFLELEPGLNFLEVIRQPIHDWDTFCEWVRVLYKDGGKTYDAICVDTGDVLSMRCSAATNAKQGIVHESDADYGKGWNVARTELELWVNRLAAVPNTGLIIISHSNDKEIKTRNETYDRAMPSMDKKGREVFLNLADLVVFADFEITAEGEERRVMRTKPSKYWEAKDRGNRLPETIVWPEGGGFQALDQAWKGQN